VRAFERVRSRAVPLGRADVDTDQIIPAQHLKRIERSGFGRFAFEAWRQDETFVLNRPEYGGAQILIAGPNFGCGSSREHAAWALEDFGFRVVVAPSFADIFRNNCANVGVLTVTLPEERVSALLALAEADPTGEFEVDLEACRLTAPDGSADSIQVDSFVRENLLHGRDKVELTLLRSEEIAAFEKGRPDYRPRFGTTT